MIVLLVNAQQTPNTKATPEMPAPSPELESRLAKMMSEGFDDDGDNYNIFSALLRSSGFDEEMKDTAGKNLTIFAPTDSAFMRALRVFGGEPKTEQSTFDSFVASLNEGVELEGTKVKGRILLRALLAYHIVGGLFGKEDLEKAIVLVTALGVPVTFAGNGEIIDLSPKTPNSMVIKAGKPDDGTIMHTINYILLPFGRDAEKLPVCMK